ncbi:arabinose efflux permease family protein [Desulfosporosinus youngiae DSM 17734]|uniref:Arabinose efflux permease family protein n=2 Tax=Desulfosporosinus TaxID=79206 RepID=H5XUN9_9FIRM|nr:arabinose efflux permease family protein [Desulfosporosinus youngiae DSM 17734]
MRKAWAVMWAVYLASVAVVINQFKVPPVMDMLLDQLQIDLTLGGWLMSVFAVAGVVLSLPAALILDRLGPKSGGMIALICTIIGSTLGAVAESAAMLLLGRTIEGIGLGLIAVVAPAVIAMWFPPAQRGLPMGIWASWVPLGSFLIFNLANPLKSAYNWQGVWWFGSLAALVALVVYWGVVTSPGDSKADTQKAVEENPQVSYAAGFKSPAIWLLALGFGAFGFANAGFTTWAPRFFTDVHGIPPGTANFYTSISPMCSILTTVLAGWAIDYFKKPKAILLISAVFTLIFYGYAFLIGSASLILPWMILTGLIVGFYPTATFTLAPEAVCSPRLAGLAMAILNLLFNAGFMLGPPVVGFVVNNAQGNWGTASIPIAILLTAAIAASLGFAAVSRKKEMT